MIAPQASRAPRIPRWKPRVAEAAVAGAVLFYAAVLRIDAFVHTWGPVPAAAFLERLQLRLAELGALLRPDSFPWALRQLPYRFDPAGYLEAAREMGNFYRPHRREPLFVLATKIGLWASGGHDTAVSLASSVAGWLLVPATYLLGRRLGGPLVGLPAALVVALEPELLRAGTTGYRDDLFATLVVLFAWSCLGFRERPTRWTAALVGVTGGLACLTRITALSFVAPALAFLAWGIVRPAVAEGDDTSWRGGAAAARPALVAGLVVLVLVAPYLASCWLEFGDPLHAINVHTAFYRDRAGDNPRAPMDVGSYLLDQVDDDPVAVVETASHGLTIYPWSNKWSGLARHWGSGLALALKWLSLAGVLAWLWTGRGRLLLTILLASLLPYAFTHEIRGGAEWRFTMHAYPFLVVAACWIVVQAARWWSLAPEPRVLARRLLATGALAVGWLGFLLLLPPLEVYLDLTGGRATSVVADPWHDAFFGDDWHAVEAEGAVTVRYVDGDRGTVHVPMDGGRDYRMVLRVDPVPEPPPRPVVLEVHVNGIWSERVRLRSDPAEFGSYELLIPAEFIEDGMNRFQLIAWDAGGRRPASARERVSEFKLWYIRFFPLEATGDDPVE